MRAFGSTVRTLILLGLAFGAGGLWQRANTPVTPLDVHISGDGAPQVAEAYFTWPGPPRARNAEFASTQVLLFRRWQNIEGIADVVRLCGAACDGRASVVTLRRPALNGESRFILVHLGDHGVGENLDRGAPIPEHILSCVVQAIEIARTDGLWKISKCDVQDSVVALRPRVWTPRPASGGMLSGL